jgi:DNA-binding NarL/FixJ family response regulator
MTISLLAVDDHPSIRRLITVLAEQDERYSRVATAADATEALAAATERPDAILLDAALGRSDGLELIPRLRAAAPQAVIAVHSSAPYASEEIAVQAGADVFIPKGTDPEELLTILVDLVSPRVIDLVEDPAAHEP